MIWKVVEVRLEPKLFLGDEFVDFRGVVQHNNDLNLEGYNRIYTIKNSEMHPFRGWHGHARESKIFIASRGSFRVGAVKVSNMLKPDTSVHPSWFELKANQLHGLFIPGGYANACISLEPESVLLVLSNATLSESLDDDFRFPKETWKL